MAGPIGTGLSQKRKTRLIDQTKVNKDYINIPTQTSGIFAHVVVRSLCSCCYFSRARVGWVRLQQLGDVGLRAAIVGLFPAVLTSRAERAATSRAEHRAGTAGLLTLSWTS